MPQDHDDLAPAENTPAPTAADLQDEARQRLPVANLVHRVTVTATAPKTPEQDPDGR